MTDREQVEKDLARAKRGRRLLIVAVAFLCVVSAGGLIGAVVANVVNVGQGRKITKIERSACAKSPTSDACQRIKRLSDEQRSVPSTCVLFEKVDKEGKLLRLTRCGTPVEQGVDDQVAAVEEGGGAQQSPQKGSQQPGPRGGGQHHSSAGGEHPAPEPTADSPAAEPAPTGSSAGAVPPASSPSEPPARGLVEQATDAAAEAVERVGDEVSNVLNEAGCSTPPICTK
ncbi:MAG TPA: hypothetical protein VFN92_08220 [Solirubrobacterales bacterium]|nr:hypothetical protein [Solirubrobacterales bacterium]